jgi:hypothetical protein
MKVVLMFLLLLPTVTVFDDETAVPWDGVCHDVVGWNREGRKRGKRDV